MDVVGPASSPLPRAQRVIDDAIAPRAEHVDREGVPRASIDALASAGLLGDPLPAPEQRELAELIAMADASTWFCWVQHQSPLRALHQAPEQLKSRWLPGLRSGALLGAIAFAHLRRPGAPNPTAERADDGWRINGTLDWVTSWDIADVVVCQVAVTGDEAGSLVTFAMPGGQQRPAEVAGLSIGEPLRLLAMSGTHTRPIVFDDVLIVNDDVIEVSELAEWRRADAVKAADANPAAFGVTRGALAELAGLAAERPELMDVVHNLVDECRELRSTAYALSDRATEANIEERTAVRAASLDLVLRAATAVVIARAGAAMRDGCSAERRVREALFLQVQAQTAASRAAGLARIATRGR